MKDQRTAVSRIILVLASLLTAASQGCSDAASSDGSGPPRVVFSTDIATGLIDTHGAAGQCAVDFSNTSAYRDDGYTPQDVDDGWAVAMALNLAEDGLVDVAGVFPIFGNATLPAEMLVARQIVWNLKGRTDVPIEAGAMAPATQTLRAATQWYDAAPVPIAGEGGAFEASCRNAAVLGMESLLLASDRPVTILAIGPLTDVACLLTTAPEVAPRIAEIVILASRLEGESLTINGKTVNDFNFRMDPGGGTLLLGAPEARDVPIRLMSFSLTGQTVQADDLIVFDSTTLHGPTPPTEASRRSLDWMLRAQEPRQEYWTDIFGTPEGPFDQYTLAASVWPELFDCREGRAYVVECPYPAWSPDYPVDATGDPTESPYGAPDNPCVDHGPSNGAALAAVPAQLVVSLDPVESGPLVRGVDGVTGNLPLRDVPARRVTVCVDFSSDAARDEFQDLLYEYSW